MPNPSSVTVTHTLTRFGESETALASTFTRTYYPRLLNLMPF